MSSPREEVKIRKRRSAKTSHEAFQHSSGAAENEPVKETEREWPGGRKKTRRVRWLENQVKKGFNRG